VGERRLTRREAKVIASRKLGELGGLPAATLLERYAPGGRGPEVAFDETDPVSGKAYMCVVVAAEVRRSGEVLLTTQVQPPFPDPGGRPRLQRLQDWVPSGLRWVLPVQRSVRLPGAPR
jgi:hypothetical protein